MLINHSKGNNRQAPNDLSDYARTYNHAIDLVTQAVGWANKVSTLQVAAIILKPTQYRLFIEGYKAIFKSRNMEFPEGTEITFEGYRILEGPRGMIDSLKIEFVENAINKKLYS